MATKFARGEVVELVALIPTGPVQSLRMDEDGNVFYLVEWTDAAGVAQTRWFAEDELAAVGA